MRLELIQQHVLIQFFAAVAQAAPAAQGDLIVGRLILDEAGGAKLVVVQRHCWDLYRSKSAQVTQNGHGGEPRPLR